VGAIYFDETDAEGLRNYLLKGGFLWVDDFWGEYAWRGWETEIRKVSPAGEYPMMDIPLAHPIFHVLYEVNEVPQIPSIGFWFGTGGRNSWGGASPRSPNAGAVGRGAELVSASTPKFRTSAGSSISVEG